jgi:hypothetical protein
VATSRRRRALIIGLIGAIVIVLGFVAGRLASSHNERPRRRLVATSRDQHAIVVEPIPVDPAQVDAIDPEEIEMTPEPDDPTKPRTGVRPSHRPNPRRDVRTPTPPVPAVAPFTHEQLGQKFQQVRREYDDYKAKFGSRLEKEWGELATFIQYMPASEDDTGRKEAARRLDVFRARMRE